jgi:glycosyltransferase involved in cell wall biosynthesis
VEHPDPILVESFPARRTSLRIAIVTETFPPEVNGVAMTLGRIVEGVLQRGHAVQVVRPRQSVEHTQPSREGLDHVLATGLPLPGYGDFRFGLPARARLTKLWSHQRPDVVHVVTEGPLGWSAVAAARKLGLPVTSSFHTNFQSYSGHYGIGLLRTSIEAYLRKLHNRTQATLVPTRAMMQTLQAQGYQNVGLLSRGVATDLFTPTQRSEVLRKAWGAGPDDLVVILVGRLAKEKNVALVVTAFEAIQQRHPSAKLVFVGDGPMRASLQATCPAAVFCGSRKGADLAAHYASGDLFLFPSLTETFGNVVPEALASGLAVVSYACAAALELIEPGRNGLLVEPGAESDFVAAALAVAQNAALRNDLRLAAPASVAHLAWDGIFDGFLDTLLRVVQSHGQPFASAGTLATSNSVKHSSA